MITMRQLLGVSALSVTALSYVPSKLQGAVLFADSFDRSPAGVQLTDIDSSTTGVTAAFALPSPLYVERDEFLAGPLNSGPLTQAQADALIHVENDQLHLAYGPNASVMHINHNFVGAGITRLKASFDVVSNDGGAEAANQRWVGIGFGGTQAEGEAARYDFGSTAALPGWKGHQNGTTAGSGFADFFVAWERVPSTADNLGRIVVYRNGLRGTIFDNGGANYLQGAKLEVDLAITDFNAGSSVVAADINYGGSLLGAENFTWDNTDVNYIGITARQDSDGWTVDNLLIEATVVPEPSSLALGAALMAFCGSTMRTRKQRR